VQAASLMRVSASLLPTGISAYGTLWLKQPSMFRDAKHHPRSLPAWLPPQGAGGHRLLRAPSESLAELSAELGQSKPTVFRVLHTLADFGYLERDPATGRYARGLRMHTLGSVALRHQQLRWQALPPLQDLARATGETVHVGILYDGEAICVQAVDGTRLIRTHALVGKRTPAHASALGKVLLAHLPDAELDALICAPGLPRVTANSITDPARLRRALHQVRTRGWALLTRRWSLACAASARQLSIMPTGPVPRWRSPPRRTTSPGSQWRARPPQGGSRGCWAAR
jgi:DNA-binding IclR family transcriptional regulator